LRKGRAKILVGIGAAEVSESVHDEIAQLVARLGITAERVRQEYAQIALSDLCRFADRGPDGLVPKTPEVLTEADAVTISEITTAGAGSRQYA
jgi:hypothetical protein